MKIYVACGLTHVPREIFDRYVAFIHRLADRIGADGNNFVKYALVNSDPQLAEKPFNERARLCYLWDREMVRESDVLIAEASFPSTGMGVELQIAEETGIPIVLCFGTCWNNKAKPTQYENPDLSRHNLQLGDGYVSLMALGIPQVFRVVAYHNEEEGLSAAVDCLALLTKRTE